jgi:Zn-dependent protease
MFPRAFRVARIAGVDVRVDPTWIIIVALVVWSFFGRFSVARPGGVALVMAAWAALGFFASLLGHELAHAVEAKSRGMSVRSITLFLFGGVTEITSETKRARDEFAVAAIGPYSSIVFAAVLGLITAGLDQWVPAAAAISDVTGTLAWINLALAIFNLIPGAPLDGGRVLRAGLWALTRDRYRSARWAAVTGQAVAVGLWSLATWQVLEQPERLINAAWLGFIGWFLWNAAANERRSANTLQRLEGVSTKALTRAATRPRTHQATPLGVVDGHLRSARESFLIVEDDDHAIVGVIGQAAVETVPVVDRGFRVVRDVMTPLRDLPRASVDGPLLDVVRLLQEYPAIVLHDDTDIVAVTGREEADALIRSLQAAPR